jgi:hypothetical protein
MVSAAVAGDGLVSVAASASEALGSTVAISVPALGPPVVWPADANAPEELEYLTGPAETLLLGEQGKRPPRIADLVAVRIGDETIGVVAAIDGGRPNPDRRAWLEAAAAAATVAVLMRESHNGDLEAARRELLQALAARPPVDPEALVAQARRLRLDLSSGAIAICARRPGHDPLELGAESGALLSDMGNGLLLGLLPATAEAGAEPIAQELASRGMRVALSSPRKDPGALHEALREAELMLELADRPDAMLAGQEETYRLLIGVLLRDPEELEALRAHTVSALARYDADHDAELLMTLQTFLAHHGSTTETAEAMSLHRHTVGYRLARVHEVSGLSPYESDGRERLSLGLKAHQILVADSRRQQRN